MRKIFRLNVGSPSATMDLDFEAVAVVVNNPTGSPVFIRVGSPDIPTETNADLFVPSGQSQSYPVSGYTFAATLGNVAAVASSATALSGLFQTCIVTFLSPGETIPAYGSASFLSLSISELRPITAYTGVTTSPTFDIGAWGGALVYVNPGSASGQAVIAINVSNTGVAGTFTPFGTYAVWPNVPAVLMIPRVARYFQVIINATSIPGEPAIAGNYAVRATLAEIFQESYQIIGASITKSYSVLALSEQDFIFVTTGVPAVSIGLNRTTGSDAELIVRVSQSPSGPWRNVTIREQAMGSGLGVSMFRSVGALDQYMQVSILETSNVAMTGTLTMQIPPVTDLSGALNNILNALGDVTSPTPNVDQNIYYVLKHIRTSDDNIDSTTVSMESTLLLIDAVIGSISSDMGTVLANLSSILANQGTELGNLATIIGGQVPITAAQTKSSYITSGTFTPGASNAYQQAGFVLIANSWIQSATVSIAANALAGAADALILMSWGTIGAPVQEFYRTRIATAPLLLGGQGQVMRYDSIRAPGLLTPAANNQYLWIQAPGVVFAGLVVEWMISAVQ